LKIVWDESKRLANLAKHGLDFADLNETFFDKALVCLRTIDVGLASAKISAV
jgi:uncharacterized DUF497 family protein